MNKVKVNIDKYYRYDFDYNAIGFYLNFSCFIGNAYIHKAYHKKNLDNFNEDKFILSKSIDFSNYLHSWILYFDRKENIKK